MAASALEEKINKIRQQNEEIRRRHEEVEEDKKNAAKLNALVQMVPSTDWPERKEPPEFSNPPRTSNKSKAVKEHHEHSQQYQPVSGEGRKGHTFAQGQGPPPDPKYNFLADSEREEGERESTKDNSSRGQKYSRGMFRRKPGGKDGMQRDYRSNRGSHRDEHQPEYEAWRAERNRIDEDRISRQRTAEGNWRREWDNDKAHIMEEATRSEAKLGDYVKKDYKDFDRRYHVNGNDYTGYNRGSGHRSYRGNSRHFHNNYENCSNNTYHQDSHVKNPSEKRTVVATDKSIRVTLNQGNMAKGPVMSVKVNSPSIAGTGRVGPRQRSRVTYSSHSDVEVVSPDSESFSRPKSYEDRPKGVYHENLHKSSNLRKSQLPPKKKDFSNKSPYFRKKEIRKEDESLQKYHETELPQIEQESEKSCQPQKLEENTAEQLQDDKIVTTMNEKERNIISSGESDLDNIEIKGTDNQTGNLNLYLNEESEVHAGTEGEADLQNLDLPMSEIDMEIEICEKNGKMEDKLDESPNVQAVVTSEYETPEIKLTILSEKDDNDKNENYMENSPCDANKDTKEIVMENEDHNSEQTKYIENSPCDANKDTKEIVMENKDHNSEQTKYIENSPCDANKDTMEIVMENEDHNSEQTKYIENSPCDANKDTKEIVMENKDHNSEQTKYMENSSCDANKDTKEIVMENEDHNSKQTKYMENSPCDANKDIKEIVIENEDHNSEQIKEIISDNCDNKQTKDLNEQENNIKHYTTSSPEEKKVNSVTIPSSIDVDYIAEQSDKLKSKDKALKEEEILAIENEVVIIDEEINTGDKQDVIKYINETQERIDNNEKENSVANTTVVDKTESLKKDLHVEEKKAASSDQN